MSFCNKTIVGIIFVVAFVSCKKLLQIPAPVGEVSTSQVFSTDNEASAAVASMYYTMINGGQTFSDYSITIFCGMSADELEYFDQGQVNDQFLQNELSPTNGVVTGVFWQGPYSTLYTANAIIEGLQTYSGVTDSVKNELMGEAEFVRAFCNFYLVNLFGDVPLVTTIDWRKTNLLSRSTVAQVYAAIVTDLKDAENRLPGDYSVGQGQRIVPNKWAASALLARTYLYLNEYDSAESESTKVINNTSLYSLDNSLDSVFLANSTEAIWQLQQGNQISPSFNATPEGAQFVPSILNGSYAPVYIMTDGLLNSFETGDQRRINWVDSTQYSGVVYYFPYKYQMGLDQAVAGGPDSQYYMVFRLAEQFLIRSEARAQQGETNWIDDLNVIRVRAGLGPYAGPTDPASTLGAIYHERRIELFDEWGHRWLDLKRTGTALSVLDTISVKAGITKNSLLYPIPTTELVTDPNMTQNPGYLQ